MNAENVRAAIDAWNRRDMGAFAAFVTSDFEWVEHEEGLDAGTPRVGAEGVEALTAELDEDLENYTADIVDVVEVGSDQVVAVLRESGSGVGSGAPFSSEFGYLITLRGGKAAKIEVFRRPADAFAAAHS